MAQHVIGIDISDRSVEVVRLLSHKGETILSGAVRAEIPAGTIQRGIVEDVPRLSAVLTGLLDDLLGQKRRAVDASVCIPETVVFSKLFRMPTTLSDELVGKALMLEAADVMPIGLDDVTSDFVTVSKDAERQDVMLSVVSNDVVAKYVEALTIAGVQPRFIDAQSMALVRTLLPKPEPEPVLIADVGARTTMLIISELGGVRSTANIAFGGDVLNEALGHQLKLTVDEAETVKRKAGFNLEVEDGRIALILQQPMRRLIDEIRRTLDYHEQSSGRAVQHIILAGGLSLMPDIVEYLASNFSDLQITKPDPLRDIVLDEALDTKEFRAEGILYATALGLATRDLGVRAGPGIDILPRRGERMGLAGTLGSVAASLGSLTSFMGRMTPRKTSQSKKATTPKKRAVAKKDVVAKDDALEEVNVASEPTGEDVAAVESSPKSETKEAATKKATKKKASSKKVKKEDKVADEVKDAPTEAGAVDAVAPQKEEEVIEVKKEGPKTNTAVSKHDAAKETAKKDKGPVVDTNGDIFGEGGEHEYGRGVGDLLGSVNSVGHTAIEHTEAHGDGGTGDPDTALPAVGTGKISIESILKKKVAGEPVFEDDEEPLADDEEVDVNEEHMDEETIDQEGAESADSVEDIIPDEDDDMEEDEVAAVTRKRGPVPALTAVLIIFVLVAITGIAMFFRKNGLPSVGFLSGWFGPKAAEQTQQDPTLADGAEEETIPTAVAVTFRVALDGEQDGITPLLLTRAVETDVTLSDSFPATGSAPAADALATGTITIVNETSTPYTFVATTRFLNPDGVLFRMKETNAIPANGSVDVEVYADEAGSSGDIGPSTFTIPGLSESLQAVVYGRSAASMSGGSGTVKAVSKDDIELARSVLEKRLQEEGEKNFKAMVRDGERILSDLITSSQLSFEGDDEGTTGSTFTATLELRFRALLVPEADVLELLENKLAMELPEGEDGTGLDLGSIFYTVQQYGTDPERAEIRAEAAVRQ